MIDHRKSKLSSAIDLTFGALLLPKDNGSTLCVLHAFSPCSPFHSPSASWANTILDLLSCDDSHLLALATARCSFVLIASGRQLLQMPTYIVRAQLGSPPQSLLLAVDTNSDVVAWLPCFGCPSSAVVQPFDPSRSTTYRPIAYGAAPCL